METARRDEDLAHLLSQAERRVTERLSAALEAEGLTLAQWRVLSLLSDGTGHPMSEAAEFAMLPAPSLTKVVDRMVSLNLVYRRPDLRDRRRVLIYSAARGRRLYQRLARALGPAVRVLGDMADGQDAAQLARLLLRILERPP
ncbi:MAG TPA: MarR family transcriptional regulator [Actinomycetota bacterium]|jgi:DNA-binding MarR family transcriptional regulator|nr:MarR family transcriptional regulator [Actinomycetota bacterium]